MNAEELRKAIRIRPFRPFTLHLADGREVPVTHPELILVNREVEMAAVSTREAIEIVDLPSITGVRYRRRPRSA